MKNLFRDPNQVSEPKVIEKPIEHSASYSEKSPLHPVSQDSSTCHEYIVKLKDGDEVLLTLGGVFDTVGQDVVNPNRSDLFGSEIAVKYIDYQMGKLVHAISNAPNISVAAQGMKVLIEDLLIKIHEEIDIRMAYSVCGGISVSMKGKDERYIIIANCGDTRTYIFYPGTNVSPQVPILDHSHWLNSHREIIIEEFANRYPEHYISIKKDKNKFRILLEMVMDELRRFQVFAYSSSVKNNPNSIFELSINYPIESGKTLKFTYPIITSSYLYFSNSIISSLGGDLNRNIDTYTLKLDDSTPVILLSCTDGVYEMIPIEVLKQIVDLEYKPNDPFSLSRISQIIRHNAATQMQLNIQNKQRSPFNKSVDDQGLAISEIK